MEVFIAIGSNLGRREENIKKAISYLKSIPSIAIEKISKIIETKPQGGPSQDDYLNGVIKINTSLGAEELLNVLQDIERKLKRARTVKNGPRTIDLDILLYGDRIIDEPHLKIPHPKMFEREFVLKPLFEIEPAMKGRLASLKIKVNR